MPVHQIIATLEEQMQIDDEDPAGDHEEECDGDGQGAGDCSGVKVELVGGDCSKGNPVPCHQLAQQIITFFSFIQKLFLLRDAIKTKTILCDL